MHKLEAGWVFNPEEESLVLSEEKGAAMMLRSAAHVRGCCLGGHRCKRGDRCRNRCLGCHQDAMAAWDGRKRELSQQADRFLEAHDGIPVVMEKVSPLPPVDAVVKAVLASLRDMGIEF